MDHASWSWYAPCSSSAWPQRNAAQEEHLHNTNTCPAQKEKTQKNSAFCDIIVVELISPAFVESVQAGRIRTQ